MKHLVLFFVVLFLGVSAGLAGAPRAAVAAEQGVDVTAAVADMERAGAAAISQYDPSRGQETGGAFSDIYFDLFEGSGMEMAVGLADPERKTLLESLFAQTIGKANSGAPVEEVTAAWNKLLAEVSATAAAQTDQTGGIWTAVQAFVILLREGFEAILVVAALIAYLQRSGNPTQVRYIWQGVGAALLASLVTAWLMGRVIQVSGAGREALEGVTMLIAALVLFYVSYWLLAKSQAGRWKAYVHGKIDRASEGNKVFALAFAAFLAVYREGAETVLFYQALAAGNQAQGSAIIGGFAVALLALGAIYWLMRSASLKLPLGLFFTATAILLYYLSVQFAGRGVLELQGAQWVSFTPVAGVPSISWLGLFPTVESLAAQALLLAPLPFAWWLARKYKKAVVEPETLAR